MTIHKTAQLLALALLLGPLSNHAGEPEFPDKESLALVDLKRSSDPESAPQHPNIIRGLVNHKKLVKAVFAAGMALSFAGLATDIVSSELSGNNILNRVAIPEWRDFDPTSCAIATIECTPHENAEFKEICQRFETENIIRRTTKRGGPNRSGHSDIPGNKKKKPYLISSVPATCNEACNSVINPVECQTMAIENGTVIMQECNTEIIPDQVSKSRINTLFSSLFRLGQLGSLMYLYALSTHTFN